MGFVAAASVTTALAFDRFAALKTVRQAVNRGFRLHASQRMAYLDRLDPVLAQRRVWRQLVQKASRTKFGRDHGFAKFRGIADYQAAVPLRDYESLWRDYLQPAFPVFENLTWPGRIPYLALTSGTTLGATKWVPVSRAMLGSNRKAAQTMVAAYMASRPDSGLFRGKMFFLGGSTALERPAPGVAMGDLSAIATLEAGDWVRPYAFPPPSLALEADWDRKLSILAERALREPIRLVGGVPSWLLVLFDRLLEITGKATIADVWPQLEVVTHGGVKFDPYRSAFRERLGDPSIRFQECYPCSEGFVAYGDPQTGHLRLMLDHGLFYEFTPVEELGRSRPTRHWLGNVEVGVNYAIVVSTCAGLWSHLIGDTIRFESLDPPLLTFTGRTKYCLSAFGEHLISEEVEQALAKAAEATSAAISEWHVGPIFEGKLGRHCYAIEFFRAPDDADAFMRTLDAELRERNADYNAHRLDGVGLPIPELKIVRPGGFRDWMRSRGKLGGQNKVPRMDNSGELTRQALRFFADS